jgi:hypothetical protein
MNYEKPWLYIPGDFYRICDRCGRKIRSSESKRTWDNLWVCPNDWEPRHPQELLNPAPSDRQAVDDPRPRPENVFITTAITQEDL